MARPCEGEDMTMDMATLTHNESDRALIAHALTVADDLDVEQEPANSARAVIVELCKRMHLKIIALASITQLPEREPEPINAERYTFGHLVLAAVIGSGVGLLAGWVVYRLTQNGGGFV